METLNTEQGFSPGAELWIISQQHQGWMQKLDWYLNFLPTRTKYHHAHVIPQDMLEITRDLGLDVDPVASSKTDAILVPSSQWLSNQFTLIIRDDLSTAEFIKTALDSWKKLKSPTCRLFLKKQSDKKDWQSYFKNEETKGLSIVHGEP